MEWKTYALSIELAERIEKIWRALGYSSQTAFVQDAVRRLLEEKEREYDGIQEEREIGRKVLGRGE